MNRKMVVAALSIIAIVFTVSYAYYYTDSYEAQANQVFKEVLEDFQKIRGYNISDVQLKIVTKDWVVQQWGGRSYDEEALKDDETFYKALMLAKSNFSVERQKDEEVGLFMAFAWKGDIYVVKENFDPGSDSARETLAHELEHIVQERYFNLTSDGSYDGDKASAAIIEGDAVVAGWVYAGKNLSAEVKNEVEKAHEEINENNSLTTLFLFPYHYGSTFMARFYLDGGFDEVNRVLTRPPVTTEQVIHVEKYLSSETFRNFEGYNPEALKGWRVVKDTRMGEYFLYIFLATHVFDSAAYNAASGWDGDRLTLYRNGDDFKWRWKIGFDTASDANEFYIATALMLNKLGTKTSDSSWVIGEPYAKQKITVEIDGDVITLYGESIHPQSFQPTRS